MSYTGKLFKYVNESKSWEEAKIACDLDGGRLAVLNGEHWVKMVQEKFGGKRFWIGASDTGEFHRGTVG